MSKDSDKAEPSMDDILASIRRIIDEDGSKTRKPVAPSPAKPPADILELTEMVNDDGSVTTLQERSSGPQPAQQTRMIDDEEPPIYADRGDRGEQPPGFVAPEIIRPTLAGDPRPQPTQPSIPERAMPPAAPPAAPTMQPTPSRPQPAAPATQPPPTAPQPPVASPTPRMQATPSVAGSQFSLTPVSTNPTASPTPTPSASSPGVNAAAAAFDRLAQAALLQQQAAAAPPPAPRTPSPTVGGRALEDMVGEMLRPMLQQWLDANLPGIVERLVQAEIHKMTKR